MPDFRVLVAHEVTLYRQALCDALRAYSDIALTPPARHFDEASRIIVEYHPQVIVSDTATFAGERAERLVRSFSWGPTLIVVTDEPEPAFAHEGDQVLYFYSHGYLVDLYRMIRASGMRKPFVQPAPLKNLLSYLRALEERGLSSEQLVLALDREELRIVIDIIRGKDSDEIAKELSLDEAVFELRMRQLLRKIQTLIGEGPAKPAR